MLSVFTLPFGFREPPYDWLIVCLILLNIVALIALFTAYIQFKVKPPLPKFNIHSTWGFMKEFAFWRTGYIASILFFDFILLLTYIGMVSARITHLILFE